MWVLQLQRPRRAGLVALFACALLTACTLDARPALLGDRGSLSPDRNNGAANGNGQPLSPSDGPSQPVNPTPLAPGEIGAGGATPIASDAFGLSCADLACPVAPSGTTQCCTTRADVDAFKARAVDRCGLDMFGDGACSELEQAGVTDDRCSAGTPEGAVLEEVGCCTDQGLCGTFNLSHGLGCHYASGSAPESCGEDLIDESVTCDLAGVYGIRVRIDVAWGGNSGGLFDLTDAGRGFIEIHLKAVVDKINDDLSFFARVQPCGAKLPPFYSSVLCESYQPIFPEAIWDDGEVPELPVLGRTQCLNPGCVLSMDASTGLIGILLDNPEGPWPTAEETTSFACPAGTGLECFPDHDKDGLPGVTVELLTQGQAPPASMCNGVYDYRGAPLSANPFAIFDGVKRTDRLQLGTRVRLGGSGRIADDCMSGFGGGIAEFVQSRAAGCFAEAGTANAFELPAGPNDECSDAEALFMNQNLPSYRILRLNEVPPPELGLADAQPSAGPEFSLVRLGPPGTSVSCADARSASY